MEIKCYAKDFEENIYYRVVLPKLQGKGIGRMIIETLERDEYFLRARRIEIPSYIQLVNFIRNWDMIIKWDC